MGFQVT